MIDRNTAAAVAALALCRVALGQAGGLILYENGSPDMGSSYAGAGARAQDAATAFTNPAGMTHLEENNLLLGTMAILSDLELELDAPGTISVPPGSLDLTYAYVGAYEVTVPAGTFETVLLRWRYDGKVGPATVKDDQHWFFAEGIGPVARIDRKDVSAMLVYRDKSKVAGVLLDRR